LLFQESNSAELPGLPAWRKRKPSERGWGRKDLRKETFCNRLTCGPKQVERTNELRREGPGKKCLDGPSRLPKRGKEKRRQMLPARARTSWDSSQAHWERNWDEGRVRDFSKARRGLLASRTEKEGVEKSCGQPTGRGGKPAIGGRLRKKVSGGKRGEKRGTNPTQQHEIKGGKKVCSTKKILRPL